MHTSPSVAIVRGKFLNRYEMQFFEPLADRYRITAYGSHTSFHHRFAFPVRELWSPMDLPDLPYKMPILNRLFTDAHVLFGLERALTGTNLVHTAETYYHYTQQCLDAKRNGRVGAVIATVLENIPFNNEGIRGRKAFKARARRELDHIIALTEKTREALLAEGADPKRMSVIPHFVDTKRFRPKVGKRGTPESGRLTILFAGRLEEYKGVYDIADALLELETDREVSGVPLTMVYAGTGSERQKLQQVRFRHRRDWHFRFESASYDQMPEVYRGADIFVAPSKPRIVTRWGESVTTWEEQYCTALLEAQAVGLPIVTTRSGGIPENVGGAAIVVSPGDVAALARSIKSFLLSEPLRRRYAGLARKRAVSVHDSLLGAARIAEVYERVLRS